MRTLTAALLLCLLATVASAFPEGNRRIETDPGEDQRTQAWYGGKIYDTNPEDPEDQGILVGYYSDNGDGTWDVTMWDPEREEHVHCRLVWDPDFENWWLDEYCYDPETGEYFMWPYARVE